MLTMNEIYERMDHYNVIGLSVALFNKGKLSLTEGYGLQEAGTNHKISCDTIFNACSISKFAAAMLVMKFIDEGILDLDQDINQRLISWKVPE